MPKNKEPRIPRVINIDGKHYRAVMVDRDPVYLGKKHYCRGTRAFYYCTEFIDTKAENRVYVFETRQKKLHPTYKDKTPIEPKDLVPLKYKDKGYVTLEQLQSQHDGSGCEYKESTCFFFPRVTPKPVACDESVSLIT